MRLTKTQLSTFATTFPTDHLRETDCACSITLTDTVAAGLTEGSDVWDLTQTDSSHMITRRIAGRAKVKPSVTR